MAGGNSSRGGGTAAGAVRGAIAGAVGTWVMDQVGWGMYLREDSQALQREQGARVGGRTSSTEPCAH